MTCFDRHCLGNKNLVEVKGFRDDFWSGLKGEVRRLSECRQHLPWMAVRRVRFSLWIPSAGAAACLTGPPSLVEAVAGGVAG